MTQDRRLPGEFELIARYFAPLASGFPGAYGLLDDAAVIAPSAGCQLVAKTDAIIGGVHFLSDDPADLVARKALRVNLSDLAAKGAQPVAYMLALALPNTIEEDWVAAFARGLATDQAEYNVHLIGGDTDSTPGPVTIAVMAFGEIATGRIIRRGGAQAGDQIFVSGTIGDAALGLGLLRGRIPSTDAAAAQFLIGRYRLPLPRVTLGPRLVGLATAALDVSDGLIADMRHICETSHLTATIEAQRVPLSAPARMTIAGQNAGLALVLSGGDDYEILFTAPPSVADELAELSGVLGIPITAIGHMATPSPGMEAGVQVKDAAGQPFALDREGWTHF